MRDEEIDFDRVLLEDTALPKPARGHGGYHPIR